MDSHLLIKIIHMIFASLAIVVFVLRALLLFKSNLPPLPGSRSRIVLVALQHLSYSVLIIAGIVLLIQNHFIVQPWFYAKIGLFLVALSASHKAFGKRDLNMNQRKTGVVVALIAFVGLISLIVWKPNFSAPQSAHAVGISDQSIALQFTASLTHHSICQKLV